MNRYFTINYIDLAGNPVFSQHVRLYSITLYPPNFSILSTAEGQPFEISLFSAANNMKETFLKHPIVTAAEKKDIVLYFEIIGFFFIFIHVFEILTIAI